MNIKKAATTAAKSAVRKAKDNPEAALALISLLTPGLFRKLAPKVIPVIVAVVKK